MLPKLLTYIIAWISTAGAIWTLFDRAENTLSQDNREHLGGWLRSTVSRRDHWVQDFINIFDSVFGEDHFSLRCLLYSIFSSYLSVVIIFSLYLAFTGNPTLFDLQDWLSILGLTAVVNLLPDYFSLLQTRWVINYMSNLNRNNNLPILSLLLMDLIVLLIDLIFTGLISYVGLSVMLMIVAGEETRPLFMLISFGLDNSKENVLSAWWYTAFSTSVWVWIYFFAAHVLRNFAMILSWMDLENKPCNSIGIVAFFLTNIIFFIVMLLAII